MTRWNPFAKSTKAAAADAASKREPGVLDLRNKGYALDELDSAPLSLGSSDEEVLQQSLARAIQRTITDIPVADYNGVVGDAAAGDAAVRGTKIGDSFSGGQQLSIGMMSPALTSWYASQSFIGHQMCAIIGQHWLVDKACSMPGKDAIRNGWTTDFKGVEDIKQLEELAEKLTDVDSRMKIDTVMTEAAKFANVFGIRILIPIVESTDKEYYRKKFNPDGVTEGAFRGWTQIDPQWIFPLLDSVGASDPSSPEFYEPTFWVAGGITYHRSHLVILRTEEPADVLKPTYLFGGIPLTQQIAERVYAAERTANEAPLLAMSKRTTVLKVDLAKAKMKLSGFVSRLQQWITYRDNYQVKVVGKDEDMTQTDTSLADLDAVIMTQFQLVAAISGVPATKLLGTSPKGFGATGENEMKSYHEFLESIQSGWYDRFLERHYLLVSRAFLGGVVVKHTWEPVDSVGAVEAATIQKTKAETGALLIDKGVISPDEERTRVSVDKESGYSLAEDSEAPGAPAAPATGAPTEAAPTAGEENATGDDDETILNDVTAEQQAAELLLATSVALVLEEPTGPDMETVNAVIAKLTKALVDAKTTAASIAAGVTPTVQSVKPSVLPAPPAQLAKDKDAASQ